MKNLIFNNFEESFIGVVKHIHDSADHICSSRIGNMYEILGLSFEVKDPTTYKFENENIGRIGYDYANDFFNWMLSSDPNSTDEFSKKYPNVKGFLEKPKSKNLPDNFNVLYGPRIKRQLPIILRELQKNKNSRRGTLSILNEEDLLLLEAEEDPNLEFPCCDSATFSVRGNKLFMNLHMRSNNMGNVAKLDMYLWGRLMCDISELLNLELGSVYYTVVSAHIFEKDLKYFEEIGIL